MAQTEENIFIPYTDTLPALGRLLPHASPYMLETLAYEGVFESVDALIPQIKKLKEDLGITTEPLDDLLINIILLRQSPFAAKKRVEIFKSTGQEPDTDISAAITDANLLKKLNSVNDNPEQNKILAAKAALNIMTDDEALFCAALAKAIKYPLLADDLQTIAFKYGPLKTPAQTAEIFEAVLRGLPYLDDAVENLGLAARVMTDGRAQTLKNAEDYATQRKAKMIFMRKLSADKFFAAYADELTNKFFGANTIDEISSMFHHILKELPHISDIYENADIAVKVLLKKLPIKDALNQAVFQKENKTSTARVAAQSAFALEQEAYQSYRGIKSKAEVIAFFKDRLAPFDFWLQDENKHCYALSTLVGELNGSISVFTADLALSMLDAGCPEESVEIVSAGLASLQDISKEDVLAAYKKFYSAGKDHQDAARRVVNMMQ